MYVGYALIYLVVCTWDVVKYICSYLTSYIVRGHPRPGNHMQLSCLPSRPGAGPLIINADPLRRLEPNSYFSTQQV